MKELLKKMIAIPSPSRGEIDVADMLEAELKASGMNVHRTGANLWVESEPAGGYPTVMLNAHIDTVRPAAGWTRDPYSPIEEEGKIYGLGSNDDGGSVVAMIEAFRQLSAKEQPYRLVLVLSAEEEVSGVNGIELALQKTGPIDLAVVGEPTSLRIGIAEKGLMVLDCSAEGQTGHAAHGNGVNAIYQAMDDISWFRSYQFEKVSPLLGPVRMSVTQVNAGTQHNVIPGRCDFVVDVRSNEMYSNEELLEEISSAVKCSVKARSTRLGSSSIDESHPIITRAKQMRLKHFGSATLSNQALLHCPSVKIGPGATERSHTADEYIETKEIEEAVKLYVALLDNLQL